MTLNNTPFCEDPLYKEFCAFMAELDERLNEDAKVNPQKYAMNGGVGLEVLVEAMAKECAKNTPFEGKVKLISGTSFPDIIIARRFGIEVKSTKSSHWTSTGSSILESTRDPDVEYIFLTFGKLGEPVQFKSKLYEKCLSNVAVTHYPRYLIDMQLDEGETIFDKIGIDYEELRTMDNPVVPISKYYKEKLKPGQSLWWTSNEESAAPATVKLWNTLSPSEKDTYEAMEFVFFPECIMSRGSHKYERAVLWLATHQSIVNSNVRDSFSAGGQRRLTTKDGKSILMPQVFSKIAAHADEIYKCLYNSDPDELAESWGVEVQPDRLRQWIELVVREAQDAKSKENATSVLEKIFENKEQLKP